MSPPQVDGLTKNDHFRQMIRRAHERGFRPEYVAFDSWYSSLENLKCLHQLGLKWLTRLKCNRLVNPDGQGNRHLHEVDLSEKGNRVHLKGYGWILGFKIAAPDGSIDYWATNDLEMTELRRIKIGDYASRIETYHRGLKQQCGVERCQVRSGRGQRNPIGLAIRAFLRLEVNAYRTGISWFAAKVGIVREAIRAYLACPLYGL